MVFLPPEIWDTIRFSFCPWEGDGGDGDGDDDDDGRISGPGPAPSPHMQGVAKPCGQTPHSDLEEDFVKKLIKC